MATNKPQQRALSTLANAIQECIGSGLGLETISGTVANACYNLGLGTLKPLWTCPVCGDVIKEAGWGTQGNTIVMHRLGHLKARQREQDAKTMDPAAYRRKHFRVATPPGYKAAAAKAGK